MSASDFTGAYWHRDDAAAAPIVEERIDSSCSMRFSLRMMMSARATRSAASDDCCG